MHWQLIPFIRSACPGKYLAEGTVWIVVVTILAGFDIRPVQDEFGEDVIPPLRFITSITRWVHFFINRLPLLRSVVVAF